jgi:hypothetical protein
MAFSLAPADFAPITGNGIYYGNDNNPLSGRYQAMHFSGWSAATDVTAGTADTTTIALTTPAFELIQLLEIVVNYPVASGAVTTPAQLYFQTIKAGTTTPVINIPLLTAGLAGAGMVITSAASIAANTNQKFTLNTLIAATFQAAQVGQGEDNYPTAASGDLLQLLLHVKGIGGTQTLQFGYTYRELPLYPAAASLATAGTSQTFQ